MRRGWTGFALACALLCASRADAALALENVGAACENAGSSSTCDVTITVSASTTLLLCGVGYVDGGHSMSTVVWDPTGANQSLGTYDIRQKEINFTGYVAELYHKVSPTAGTSKVVRFTLDSAAAGWGGQCVTFTGGDTSTPLGTAVGADSRAGAADPVTVTATTASGEIVVDFMMAATASTAGADQTTAPSPELDSIATGNQLGMSSQAGSAGGVMSWTKDGGGTQHWSTAAVSVKAAGGGGGGSRACGLSLLGVGC